MKPKTTLPFVYKLGYNLENIKNAKMITILLGSILVPLIVYVLIVPILFQFSSNWALYTTEVLINRGPIPYVIIFFFGVLLIMLISYNLRVSFERYAFEFVKSELRLKDSMVFSDSQSILRNLNTKKYALLKNSLILKRFRRGMRRLFNTQDTNALTDYFKLRSEIEYEEIESNFAFIKYLNWLIPTLGFIGTVLGIGVGISGFANIINNAENFTEIKIFLPHVTSSLGVAFDTTFLALIISVVGMFLNSVTHRRNNVLMEEIDSYCLDEVSSRFKIHSNAAEEMKEVFRELRRDIENILNASRIEMDHKLDALIQHLSGVQGQLSQLSENQVDLSGVMIYMKNILENMEIVSNKKDIDIDPVLNELKSINKYLEKSQAGGTSKAKPNENKPEK